MAKIEFTKTELVWPGKYMESLMEKFAGKIDLI
jgi:hypothetical protein